MADPAERAAVEALARDVVQEVSPAELPLFRSTADRYFADPEGTLTRRGRPDEPLGFGVEAAVTLLGPFALELVRRVWSRLAQRVGDSVADAVADRVLRRVPDAPVSAPAAGPDPLDPAQLSLVRQVADEEARRLELPVDQAHRLADALVASIATRG